MDQLKYRAWYVTWYTQPESKHSKIQICCVDIDSYKSSYLRWYRFLSILLKLLYKELKTWISNKLVFESKSKSMKWDATIIARAFIQRKNF